jgi:putative FmdB family regulatory protein
MPIYEYQCQGCGHHLEALQKINDAPLKKCPDCGKPRLRRLLSAPMFLLKGSGWYETDFKSDKERKKNLADRPEKEEKDKEDKKEEKAPAKTDAPAADSAKADGKTESKPDSARPQPVKTSSPARKTAAHRHKRKRR